MPARKPVPKPVVLCISGHDPGGGAGLQADIETCAALGAHAATVISAHTVQDTRDVRRVVAADVELMREQLAVLRGDVEVRAVKLGLLGDAAQIPLLVETLRATRAPVVCDPVLRAGGGAELSTALLRERLVAELLPEVDVLTPNAAEARRLAGTEALDACGAALLARGPRHVLITGGDEPGDAVTNHWYAAGRSPRRFAWPRLAPAAGSGVAAGNAFHGAGCTLASAIAALLAHGNPVAQALLDAQAYTHRALRAAFAAGRGRLVPGRWP